MSPVGLIVVLIIAIVLWNVWRAMSAFRSGASAIGGLFGLNSGFASVPAGSVYGKDSATRVASIERLYRQ